jgi:integrase
MGSYLQLFVKGGSHVEAVAREWLSTVHEVKVSEGHAERTRVRFERDVFPWIGPKPIAAIEPPELLTLLRRIIARGAIETAHRAKDACGQVFRYGIACGLCQRNPVADLRDAPPPVVTRHLPAIVEPNEVAKLLRDMAGYEGHFVTRAALPCRRCCCCVLANFGTWNGDGSTSKSPWTTGFKGLAAAEYKNLWQYADAIHFGF